MELHIHDLRKLCMNSRTMLTQHAFRRCLERGIEIQDMETVIMRGAIIEQYPDDTPYPSCLIFGRTPDGLPLHVVVGSDGKKLWFITSYYPDADTWEADYQTRKEGGEK